MRIDQVQRPELRLALDAALGERRRPAPRRRPGRRPRRGRAGCRAPGGAARSGRAPASRRAGLVRDHGPRIVLLPLRRPLRPRLHGAAPAMLVYCLTRDHELAAAIEARLAECAGLLLQRRRAPAPGGDPAPARPRGGRYRRRSARSTATPGWARWSASCGSGRPRPGWRCDPRRAPSGWSRPRPARRSRCCPPSSDALRGRRWPPSAGR